MAYAAPPDFANTDLIGEYTPVIINTKDSANLTDATTLVADNGHREYEVPLDTTGGMAASFFELPTSGATSSATYEGNYVLVLGGTWCLSRSLLPVRLTVLRLEKGLKK